MTIQTVTPVEPGVRKVTPVDTIEEVFMKAYCE